MTTRWASAPDQDIVAAATAGDRDAFAALHDRYAPRIYSRFLYELRDVADAQDATQQTFVEVWRSLPQLRNPAALPGWLATIADRQAMHTRKPRRFHEEPVVWGQEHADPAPGPDAELMRAEARELVQDALVSLTPRYQQALRYLMEHGQAGAGLAAHLQVEPAQASRLADKAMHSLADAVRALVLARTGRAGCARLDELLRDAGWQEGPLSAELRSSVQRHAGQCAMCGEQRQAVARRVIGALPAVFPAIVPPQLRDAILADPRAAASAAPATAASASGSDGPSPHDPGSTGPGRPADAPTGTGRGAGPWRRRAIAVGAGAAVLAAAVLVLRGGGDAGEAPSSVAAEGSGEDTRDDDAAPSLADLDLVGLVTLDEEGDMNGGGEVVRFVDPESGEDGTVLPLVTGTIDDIPWRSNGDNNVVLSRQAFSPDWRYVAGSTGSGDGYASTVWVRELDPATGEYQDLLTVDGNDAASYDSEPVEYRNPRFAPDGETLWMESRPLGRFEVTLVSIDVPTHEAGTAPEASSLSFEHDDTYIGGALEVASYDHWMLDDAGQPILTLPGDRQPIYDPESSEPLIGERDHLASYFVGPSGEVVALDVYLPNTHGAGDPSTCTDLGRTDDGDFLVGRCDGSAVARAQVDPDGGTIELTELVPVGAGGTPDEVLISPDRSEVLMQVEDVWYRASLADSGAEPQPVDGLTVDPRGMDANSGPILSWE